MSQQNTTIKPQKMPLTTKLVVGAMAGGKKNPSTLKNSR